jgi:hypothetical protein
VARSLVRLWRRLMLAVDPRWLYLDLRLLSNGQSRRPFARRTLVRIRKAPHTWRPEVIRPASLILAYRERAAEAGVSVVPPIGLETITVIVLRATPIAVANLFDG